MRTQPIGWTDEGNPTEICWSEPANSNLRKLHNSAIDNISDTSIDSIFDTTIFTSIATTPVLPDIDFSDYDVDITDIDLDDLDLDFDVDDLSGYDDGNGLLDFISYFFDDN